MLKNLASMCAALIIAAGAFSTSAQAQRHSGGGHGGGAHFSGGHVGGGHFGGARVGGAHFGGARVAGAPFRGARVAGAPFGGRYYGRGYRGYGGPYYGGGYYGGGHYGDDWGLGALAVGAILGGVLAAQPYYGGDAVGYCMRRFKSYDPGSGTYLGYDGYRHSCP